MSEIEDDEDARPKGPQTFGQRHGVTILTGTLFGLLAFVMIIQSAC